MTGEPLDWMIDEWIAADQIEKDAADRKAELAAAILRELGPGESRRGIKVYAGNRVFNANQAMAALVDAPKQLQLISRLVPQADLARRYLDDELLDKCLKQNRPSIRAVEP